MKNKLFKLTTNSNINSCFYKYKDPFLIYNCIFQIKGVKYIRIIGHNKYGIKIGFILV